MTLAVVALGAVVLYLGAGVDFEGELSDAGVRLERKALFATFDRRIATLDAVLTMLPPPCAVICGTTARHNR